MLDELFDLFDRKKRPGDARASRKGLGGLIARVQHAMDDDDSRPYGRGERDRRDGDDDHRSSRYDDRRYRLDEDDDDDTGSRSRRSRDGFDLD